MKDKYLPFINSSITYVTTAFLFLLPVFFLPVTTEFYEFNKFALSAAVTFVLIALWAAKMLIEGKVEVTKSPLNAPILLFLIVNLVSTYFSISKYSSIYGTYGRWSGSLALVTIGSLLYFVIISNIKSSETINNLLVALLGGITLSSLLATLSYFGIRISNAPYAQGRNFTVTGSAALAATIAAIGVTIAVGKLMEVKEIKLKAVLGAVVLINFLTVAFVGSLPAWIVLIIGLVMPLILSPIERLRALGKQLPLLFGVLFILGLGLSLPQVKAKLGIPTSYSKEINLDIKSSWIITTSVLRDFPIIGTGPSTFYLNFSHYRPLALNSTDMWAAKFDKPYNEFLDVTSNLGIVGLLIFIFLCYKTLTFALRTDQSVTSLTLSSIVIGLVASLLFSYLTVLSSILLMIFLGLTVSYLATSKRAEVQGLVETAVISFFLTGSTTNVTTKTVSVMFSVPMFLLVGLGSYFGFRMYAAEVLARKAVVAAQQNRANDIYNYQAKAIAYNPYIDSYHATLAQVNFLFANSLAQSKKSTDLTDTDKQNIQSLISSSIQETRITTEALNPTNPNNWAQRGAIYSQLTGVTKDASSWAVSAYTRAIELDPTNPVLRLNIGGVYFLDKGYVNAERQFRAAALLKPDYANAHYNLAQVFKVQKKFQDAITELQVVLRLVPQDSEDFKKATSELTELTAAPENTDGLTNKPSVADLQNEATKKPTKQEPLTSPTELNNATENTPKESTPNTKPAQP